MKLRLGRTQMILNPRRLCVLVAVVVTLAISGCDWTTFGYVASGGRASPDTGISLSNVGGANVD